MLLLLTDGKKYAGLMLSILENSFLENGKLTKIACVLAPIVNNERHSYLFLTQQAGICERQARERREN